MIAAFALAPVRVHRHVSHLGEAFAGAQHQLAFGDQAAADAGAQRDHDDPAVPLTGAEIIFAHAGGLHVVAHPCGHAKVLFDGAQQLHIRPTGEIRGVKNDALLRIMPTGHAQPDAHQLLAVHLGMGHRIFNGFVDHLQRHLHALPGT